MHLSQNIHNQIRSNLSDLFAKQLEKIDDKLRQFDIGRQIYLKIVDPAEFDLAVRLNSSRNQWIPEVESIRVFIAHATDGKMATELLDIPLSEPVPVPINMNHLTHQLNSSELHYQICVDTALAKKRINKEYEHVAKNTNRLLASCGTVEQVLAEWPGMLDFVSEDTKKRFLRMKKVTPRSRSAGIPIDDEAKTFLLKARLLGDK